MICLRCGHCCKNYFVPIVDDPTKGYRNAVDVDSNIIEITRDEVRTILPDNNSFHTQYLA